MQVLYVRMHLFAGSKGIHLFDTFELPELKLLYKN